MKNHFAVLTTAILSILFSSCEKIIDVELNEADKKYVIEANVSNISGEAAEVRISQTKAFNESNVFSGISGAVVTIQVNNNTVYTLTETSTGIYQTNAFTGTPGVVYNLKVMIGTNEFTAICKMPEQLVSLEKLSVDNFGFAGNSSKVIVPEYVDPVGLGNSYRFIQWVNGVQEKRVFVYNDELSDGLRSTRPLANPNSTGDLETGDMVSIVMQCIEPAVYTYWYSLDQAATGSSNATPANPVTNIKGGALGYFSAHSISIKSIQVP